MHENRHYSLRELAQELKIWHESVCTSLVDILEMKRVTTRLVPNKINFLQKQHRKAVAEDILSRVASNIYTTHHNWWDETWVYEYNGQISQQSCEWRYKTSQNWKNRDKVDQKLKSCSQFSSTRVWCTSSAFARKYSQKRPDLWRDKSGMFHHDNTVSHKATIMSEFLTVFTRYGSMWFFPLS